MFTCSCNRNAEWFLFELLVICRLNSTLNTIKSADLARNREKFEVKICYSGDITDRYNMTYKPFLAQLMHM